MNIEKEPRLHALDHLRASMMLLGVVIHSAVSYMVFEPDLVWPYRDPATSPVFDVIVGIIHSFRMPVFFLMSGFFAALLFQKRGSREFISNRCKRILIPFILGWPILFPLIFAGFSTAIQQLGNDAYEKFINTPTEWLITLWHFWFLYYLIMFYVITVIVTQFAFPQKWTLFFEKFMAFSAGRFWGVFILGLLSAVTFLPMETGTLDSDLRWTPNGGVFLAYGFVYWCGWLLYSQRKMLMTIKRRTYSYLLLSLVTLPIASYFVLQVIHSTENTRPFPHLWAVISSGILMWSLIFGITGFFLRVLNQYNATARYLTDAAYWIYLIHLPIAIWVTGQLTQLDWAVGFKFLTTFGVTLGISLITYHYFVRSTIMGYWLNGKRV